MITFDINGNKDVDLQLDASVKEPFSYIRFSFVILQESVSFPEAIERLHESVKGLAKTSALYIKNMTRQIVQTSCFRYASTFRIFQMVFSETVARLKESV